MVVGLGRDHLDQQRQEDFGLGAELVGELLEEQKGDAGEAEGEGECRPFAEGADEQRAELSSQDEDELGVLSRFDQLEVRAVQLSMLTRWKSAP